MNRLEELAQANPVASDDDWGRTKEGQVELARLAEAIQTSNLETVGIRRNPWIYAVAGFAAVALMSLPLWFAGDAPSPDPLALPGDPYNSISEDILSDGVVTEDELNFAATAVVACSIELSEDPDFEASYQIEQDGSVSFTADTDEADTFGNCYRVIFGGIEWAWADQNEPPRAESFYFYGSVVACAEQRTGGDFGEMTRDPMGFVSTVGQRTINAALADAPKTYQACFDANLDQVAIYSQVLACIEVHADIAFVPLGTRTSEGPGSFVVRTTIDEAGFQTLDEALAAHPDLFDQCLPNVIAF